MDITMSENKMVVAVKKNFRTRCGRECRVCSLTKGDHTSG